MALTSGDETDLLLPLFGGASETMPFATFLERLRRRTGATYASVMVRHGEGSQIRDFFAGPDMRQRAGELQLGDLDLTDRILYDRLRPGRVYSNDEFDAHDVLRKATRQQAMRRLGLADMRIVRVLDAPPVSAWIVLASANACTAADSALLSSLAPFVALALRQFVRNEGERLAATASEGALERSGTGWLLFDREARLLSASTSGAAMLRQASGQAVAFGQRLRAFGLQVEHDLTTAAARFDADPNAAAQSLVLKASPRLEAILCAPPAMRLYLSAPAMIAYCRQGQEPGEARTDHFAAFHQLPRREAELAILLADGHSLAEAGQAMGLTVETTRNYSKRLFAKLGVRGQAELVRAVHRSAAMLA